MMRQVSGDDERQGAHGEWVSICGSAAHPRLWRQIAEERKCRQPHPPEFFYMSRPGNIIRSAMGHTGVLIVTRQRSLKTSGKPEDPKRENSFGVGEMIQRLPDAPFSRRISVE